MWTIVIHQKLVEWDIGLKRSLVNKTCVLDMQGKGGNQTTADGKKTTRGVVQVVLFYLCSDLAPFIFKKEFFSKCNQSSSLK